MNKFPKNTQGSGNMRNRAQISSVAPPDVTVPRGAIFKTSGGENRFCAITSWQEQDNSPNVVTGMIKVFNFNVYTLLDPRESLSFVTPYVANKFKILPKNFVNPYVFLHLLGSLF